VPPYSASAASLNFLVEPDRGVSSADRQQHEPLAHATLEQGQAGPWYGLRCALVMMCYIMRAAVQ
jgi:hypothetical protein